MNKTTVYRILDWLEGEDKFDAFRGRDILEWYARCKGCTSSHHSELHPHFQYRICGKREYLGLKLAVPAVLNHEVASTELLLPGQR
jgi:Fur family ferric uptake transcriptional regulator